MKGQRDWEGGAAGYCAWFAVAVRVFELEQDEEGSQTVARSSLSLPPTTRPRFPLALRHRTNSTACTKGGSIEQPIYSPGGVFALDSSWRLSLWTSEVDLRVHGSSELTEALRTHLPAGCSPFPATLASFVDEAPPPPLRRRVEHSPDGLLCLPQPSYRFCPCGSEGSRDKSLLQYDDPATLQNEGRRARRAQFKVPRH